jgi:hypothetical protein
LKLRKESVEIEVAIPADRNDTQGKHKRNYNITSFMYRDTTNVEHKIYNYTGNNWSNRNIKKGLKESFEAMPEKPSTDSLPKAAVLGTSH